MLQAGSLGSVEATDIFLLRHENKIMWVQVYCTQRTHVPAYLSLFRAFLCYKSSKVFYGGDQSTEKIQPPEKKKIGPLGNYRIFKKLFTIWATEIFL